MSFGALSVFPAPAGAPVAVAGFAAVGAGSAPGPAALFGAMLDGCASGPVSGPPCPPNGASVVPSAFGSPYPAIKTELAASAENLPALAIAEPVSLPAEPIAPASVSLAPAEPVVASGALRASSPRASLAMPDRDVAARPLVAAAPAATLVVEDDVRVADPDPDAPSIDVPRSDHSPAPEVVFPMLPPPAPVALAAPSPAVTAGSSFAKSAPDCAPESGSDPAAKFTPAPDASLESLAVSEKPLRESPAVAMPDSSRLAVSVVPAPARAAAVAIDAASVPCSAQAAEKLAAAPAELVAGQRIPGAEYVNKHGLLPAEKQVANSSRDAGTEDAKPVATMSRRPDSAAFVPVRAPAAGASSRRADAPTDSPAPVVPASTFTAPVAPMVPGAPSAVASPELRDPVPELRGQATDAAGAVREVVELTHEFRARERSSVEVKFHFSDERDLSVRVVYREGEVHTTFHSDSPELRAVLGQEWGEQLAAVAVGEPRGYRLADPVFTTSASAAGDDAGRRQFASPDQQAAREAASAGALARTGAPFSRAGSSSAPSAVWARPDTVRHLHVFA